MELNDGFGETPLLPLLLRIVLLRIALHRNLYSNDDNDNRNDEGDERGSKNESFTYQRYMVSRYHLEMTMAVERLQAR